MPVNYFQQSPSPPASRPNTMFTPSARRDLPPGVGTNPYAGAQQYLGPQSSIVHQARRNFEMNQQQPQRHWYQDIYDARNIANYMARGMDAPAATRQYAQDRTAFYSPQATSPLSQPPQYYPAAMPQGGMPGPLGTAGAAPMTGSQITPAPLYPYDVTSRDVNLARSEAMAQANPYFLQQAMAQPGQSFGPGGQMAMQSKQAPLMQQALQAGTQIPIEDYLESQKFLFDAEQARAGEYLKQLNQMARGYAQDIGFREGGISNISDYLSLMLR